jgi:hypothetical protein
MNKLEIYTGMKTYMTPSGTLYTQERLVQAFPAALTFTHLIHTDEGGEVCFGVYNYRTYCVQHGLNPDEQPIATIIPLLEKIMNAPVPAHVPSAEERIAAALEFQNLLMIKTEAI